MAVFGLKKHYFCPILVATGDSTIGCDDANDILLGTVFVE